MSTKPSRINSFLWYSAAADREILKDCEPKEKFYYGLIGTLVLLTSVFASISMTFAFTEQKASLGVALIIGVFWGFLIYNLDRLMIISIVKRRVKDKNERKRERNRNLRMAVPRLLLAVIISVVITKPLEIWLWKSQIKAQIFENKKNDLIATDSTFSDNFKVDETKDQLETAKQDIDTLSKDISSFKSGGDDLYKQKKQRAEVCRDEWRVLDQDVKARYRLWNSIQRGEVEGYYDEYVDRGSIIRKVNDAGKDEVNRLKEINRRKVPLRDAKGIECDGYEKEAQDYYDAELSRLNTKLISLERERDENDSLYKERVKKVEGLVSEQEEASQEDGEGIFGKLDALGDYLYADGHANRIAGDLAITFIFIMIELLPIASKLGKAPGEYDLKLESQQNEYEKQIRENEKLSLRVMNVQREVLEEALNRWKKAELAKFNYELDEEVGEEDELGS